VISTILCENCGIKIGAGQGSECPGCGHISLIVPDRVEVTENSFLAEDKNSDFFAKKSAVENWSSSYLAEYDALFDRDIPYEDQLDVILAVIERTKSILASAPDKESSCRLNSYMSEMYRLSANYSEGFASAIVGVESTEKFFNHQSHNVILDSLLHLDKHQEFEEWIKRSYEDDFPSATYYKIQFLTKLGNFDDALELCESHYSFDIRLANSNRADILVKAKRFDEAEQILRKLTAPGPRAEFVSNWINTLAYSILMPQGRYGEAERLLISALCTLSEREKINAFSNLAMLAYKMNEFQASKRFATIAANYHDNAIASESRLTLCRIEYNRLLENPELSKSEWELFFVQVKTAFDITDFDDASDFLELLVIAAEKSDKYDELVEIIEPEFVRLRKLFKWQSDPSARQSLLDIRVNVISKFYLKSSNFLELDRLFTESLAESPNQGFAGLLDYLVTPFAALDLRRSCLKVTDIEFLAKWAGFESNEEIIYGLVKNSAEPILVALAENPATPEIACELIAKKNDIDLEFALCSRDVLSKRIIQILAKSTFEAVRRLIALRSDLDDETFTALATDQAMLVRDAIRENQHCSAEIRALAALGSL
jgi:hypothetical protein